MAGLDPSVLIKYPVECTDADWQKKKGLLAKAVKTGLKAELDKGVALHAKVDTGKLSPKANSPKNFEDLEKAVAEVKKYYAATVLPLMNQMKAIESAAKDASTKLTKSKLGDASKAALNVAKAANSYALTCKSITWEDEYKEMHDRIQKRIDLAVKELKPSIDKFRKGVTSYVGSDQTNADWEKHIKQQGRSVSNSISVLDGYKQKFWPNFSKFQGFDTATLKISNDDPADKAKRLQVVKLATNMVTEIANFRPD